jgi:hypothetical protein
MPTVGSHGCMVWGAVECILWLPSVLPVARLVKGLSGPIGFT